MRECKEAAHDTPPPSQVKTSRFRRSRTSARSEIPAKIRLLLESSTDGRNCRHSRRRQRITRRLHFRDMPIRSPSNIFIRGRPEASSGIEQMDVFAYDTLSFQWAGVNPAHDNQCCSKGLVAQALWMSPLLSSHLRQLRI
jgi:hypothetical protein